MNEFDWVKILAGESTHDTRLAYSDWLEEQGFPLQAMAQRLLVRANFHFEGGRYSMDWADMPVQLKDAFRPYITRGDAANFTHSNTVHQWESEWIFLSLVRQFALEGRLEELNQPNNQDCVTETTQ